MAAKTRILVIALVLASCGRKPAQDERADAVTRFVAPPEAPVPETEPEPAVRATGADDAATDPPPEPEAPAVPAENQEQGSPPDPASAEQGARLLFEAIKNDDASLAREFFFPGPAFDLVKNMDDPSNYHRKLLKFFDEDIHAEHGRYWGVEKMEFDSFEMGRCTWTEAYTQGNKLPYWSCRNGRILARSGKKLFDYKVKTMINWGPRWYVVHLGPTRSL